MPVIEGGRQKNRVATAGEVLDASLKLNYAKEKKKKDRRKGKKEEKKGKKKGGKGKRKRPKIRIQMIYFEKFPGALPLDPAPRPSVDDRGEGLRRPFRGTLRGSGHLPSSGFLG